MTTTDTQRRGVSLPGIPLSQGRRLPAPVGASQGRLLLGITPDLLPCPPLRPFLGRPRRGPTRPGTPEYHTRTFRPLPKRGLTTRPRSLTESLETKESTHDPQISNRFILSRAPPPTVESTNSPGARSLISSDLPGETEDPYPPNEETWGLDTTVTDILPDYWSTEGSRLQSFYCSRSSST